MKGGNMGKNGNRIPGGKIELEGVLNTRDLGGYYAGDGRRIRSRRLIRSGTLADLTSHDMMILTKDYGLRTIVDFRTEGEIAEHPDPAIQGVTSIHNAILTNAQMGITHEEEENPKKFIERMIDFAREVADNPQAFGEETYPVLVTDPHPVAQYKKFFSILLNQEEGSVLWHCTVGKDRVGIGTALLLSALDVDRSTIIEDYLLTNTFVEPKTKQLVNLIKKETDDEKILKGVRILNGVEESYILTAFDTIDKTYGGMNAFLEEKMELTPDVRKKLQDKYLIQS